MAIITLHPIFQSFSGRIGGIVLYTGNSRQFARLLPQYVNPDTEAQRIVRRTFGDAVRSWQCLSPDEKLKYNRKARRLNMKGYNYYISCYMKENVPRIFAEIPGRDMFIQYRRHLSGFYPASSSVAHTMQHGVCLNSSYNHVTDCSCID